MHRWGWLGAVRLLALIAAGGCGSESARSTRPSLGMIPTAEPSMSVSSATASTQPAAGDPNVATMPETTEPPFDTLPVGPGDGGPGPGAPVDPGTSEPPVSDPTQPGTNDPTAPTATPPTGAPSQTGGPRTTAGTGTGANPAAPTSGSAPAATTTTLPWLENPNRIGGLCRSILRPAPRIRIVLEIDVLSQRLPAPEAITHLVTSLRQVTGKDVTATVRSLAVLTQTAWTITEVAAAETRYRAAPAVGTDTITIAFLYLPGQFTQSPASLGIAFRGGGAALFPDRIADAANVVVSAATIERAVLVHELGHLLCLVNVTFESARAREDPDHRFHSTNRQSVMYWAIEDVSVASALGGGPPGSFDPNDLADLADLKAGKF